MAPSVTAPAHDGELLERALFEIKRVIVGQDRLVERMLVGLLARGHCCSRACPAWPRRSRSRRSPRSSAARSPACSSPPTWCPPTSSAPASTGRASEAFDVELGPVFANFVLADEINRAPAKVQSALLEVMAERQVSIGGRHLPAARPVPRARHPEPDRDRGRLPAARGAARPLPHEDPRRLPEPRGGARDRLPDGRRAAGRRSTVLGPDELRPAAGASPSRVFVHHALVDYVVRLVVATRTPRRARPGRRRRLGVLRRAARAPRSGSSRAARALALVRGRDYVLPQDVLDVAADVLRHRLVLSYDALADGVPADHIVKRVLQTVPLPQVTPARRAPPASGRCTPARPARAAVRPAAAGPRGRPARRPGGRRPRARAAPGVIRRRRAPGAPPIRGARTGIPRLLLHPATPGVRHRAGRRATARRRRCADGPDRGRCCGRSS